MARNAYIDRLRGVAILLVLCGHSMAYGGFWALVFPLWVQSQVVFASYYGVTIFFAISGYLITSEFISSADQSLSVDLKFFYVRRIGRILPPLLALIIFSYSVVVVTGTAFKFYDVYSTAFSILTFDIARLNAATPGIAASYTVLWSLAIEEKFYLAFPLVVKVAQSNRRLIWFLVIAIVYELIARTQDYGLFDPVVDFGQIAIGCLGAMLIPNLRIRLAPWLVWMRLGGVLVLAAFLLNFNWDARFGPFLVGFATMIIITGCPAPSKPSVLPFRVLERFGQLSYEIYLIHKIVYYETGNFGRFRTTTYTSVVDWCLFACLLAVIYFISVLFARTISNPANRFIRGTFS